MRDRDLFWAGNQFTHDRDNKRPGINLLVKRYGTNLYVLLYLIWVNWFPARNKSRYLSVSIINFLLYLSFPAQIESGRNRTRPYASHDRTPREHCTQCILLSLIITCPVLYQAATLAHGPCRSSDLPERVMYQAPPTNFSTHRCLQ
jgi:hypothetical protein